MCSVQCARVWRPRMRAGRHIQMCKFFFREIRSAMRKWNEKKKRCDTNEGAKRRNDDYDDDERGTAKKRKRNDRIIKSWIFMQMRNDCRKVPISHMHKIVFLWCVFWIRLCPLFQFNLECAHTHTTHTHAFSNYAKWAAGYKRQTFSVQLIFIIVLISGFFFLWRNSFESFMIENLRRKTHYLKRTIIVE